MKKETSVSIIIVAALLIIVGYYIYRDTGMGTQENTATSTTPTTTITTNTPGYTIEQVPIETKPLPQAPSLSRPITYPSYFTEAQKTAMQENMTGVISRIAKNGKDVDAWVQLGINRKVVGDYEGAIEAWKYAAALSPTYVVPIQNIADTDHFYTKNYSESETYWKKAITLMPESPDLYKGLFDLYTLSYTEKKASASQVILDGLKAIPGNIDLMVYLAEYYKKEGDKVTARTYFEKARDAAAQKGDTNRAALLNAEIASL